MSRRRAHIIITANPVSDIEIGILTPAGAFEHITGFCDIIGVAMGFCWVSGLGAIIIVALVMIAMDITALVLGRDISTGMIGAVGIGIDQG